MKQEVLQYCEDITSGVIPSNRWIYGAVRRFLANLDRTDIRMDWEAASRAVEFIESLKLVGETFGQPFVLHPWQKWVVAQVFGLQTLEGHRLVRLCTLVVGRGAGKTTLAAAMALWELCISQGRQVVSIANKYDQAEIVLHTMQDMIRQMPETRLCARADSVVIEDDGCSYRPLAALERSLDGLNPSMWIADEAAEYSSRFLSKLITTGVKRLENTGIIVTTPGTNPESQFSEIVANGKAVLNGEVEDDSILPILYGLDAQDDEGDPANWIKANPGLPFHQPSMTSMTRQWASMKRSPTSRSEWKRYHCCMDTSSQSAWLDMTRFDRMVEDIPESLYIDKPTWVGVDLSKSRDMSSIVWITPLDDGRIYVDGAFFWPEETARERELDYRYPIFSWRDEGHLRLCHGDEVDYGEILHTLKDLCDRRDVREVGFDAWGSKYFSEVACNEGIPLKKYSMSSSTLSPGSQVLQHAYYNDLLVFANNPIFKQSFLDVAAKADDRGNIRPVKSRTYCAIDPVIATVIALHISGCGEGSAYEAEVKAKRNQRRSTL